MGNAFALGSRNHKFAMLVIFIIFVIFVIGGAGEGGSCQDEKMQTLQHFWQEAPKPYIYKLPINRPSGRYL